MERSAIHSTSMLKMHSRVWEKWDKRKGQFLAVEEKKRGRENDRHMRGLGEWQVVSLTPQSQKPLSPLLCVSFNLALSPPPPTPTCQTNCDHSDSGGGRVSVLLWFCWCERSIGFLLLRRVVMLYVLKLGVGNWIQIKISKKKKIKSR